MIQFPATDNPSRKYVNQVEQVEWEPAVAEDSHHRNKLLVHSRGPGDIVMSVSMSCQYNLGDDGKVVNAEYNDSCSCQRLCLSTERV